MKKTRIEDKHLRGKIMQTFRRSGVDKKDLASKIEVKESVVNEMLREEHLVNKNNVMDILDQNRLR